MKEEKQYTEGIATRDNKFLLWLDNYWYHYKWVTIVVAFLVIVFSICIIQACTAKAGDIKLTYAGRVPLKDSDKAAIEGVFSKKLPDEFSDGATAEMLSFYILSKEQIEAAEKETYADGDRVYIDRAFNSSEKENFDSHLQTGASSILLVDPWLYEELVGNNDSTEVIKPLSDVFGKTPQGALDDYGIRLGDTKIYNDNPELKVLPEDTVVCLFEKRLWQKEKEYEKEIAAFKSFAELDVAEEASNN